MRVISTGADLELLRLREWVLLKADFVVFSTAKVEDAIAEMAKAPCGVLLLCHSAAEEVNRELSREYRRLCPDGRVIMISNVPLQRKPGFVDAYVYGFEGPKTLIE